MGQKSSSNKSHRSESRAQRSARIQLENDTLADLEQRVKSFEPTLDLKTFEDLPISRETLRGLNKSHFVNLTDIQKKAIIPALQGNDILGAARTGSGKTLAFLVPLLEALHRRKWNQFDGLGALVISPTRELAIQIYEVLRRIGREHNFSAGLVIGGKDVQTESERLSRLSILIGTPGRLLQHMDQNSAFDLSNLQLLILDEADRILDMGFKKTVDAIVENLPSTRQTLLFSATQTKTVSDLARLSLSDPMYISVHETDVSSTPKNLKQSYVVTELYDKLDTLYGFIKTHLKAKILVFFSSSKEVRYAYETFRTLQPGIPLLHLHGKQKQAARIDITGKFSAAQYSCLFATDIVARGIDFPAVDWVIQVDCPEDADTYIHRVGRSARYGSKGKAVLFLTPKEEPVMVKRLEARRIPISRLAIRVNSQTSIKSKLQALCFKNPEIKYLGQKAFISYVRSVYVQKDKEIFNVDDLPLEEFAESLGLPGAPKVKIKGGEGNKERKNASRQLLSLVRENRDGDGENGSKPPVVRTKYDRMFERKNQNVLSDHYMNLVNGPGVEEDGGDFLTVKRVVNPDEENDSDNDQENGLTSKRATKRALSKKLSAKTKSNPTKLIFDDEGNSHSIYELQDLDDFHKAGDAESQKKSFISKESSIMKNVDVEDKEMAKEKKLGKKRRRQEAKALREEDEEEGGFQVTLASSEPPVDLGDLDYDNNYTNDFDDDNDIPSGKKPKWFQKETKNDNRSGVLEVENPETLQDLEQLSSRLLRKH